MAASKSEKLEDYLTESVHGEFRRRGLVIRTFPRGNELSDDLKSEIFDLFSTNMEQMYRLSSFGWNVEEKKREMFGVESRYLLVFKDELLVGFVHFQFTREDNRRVLYIYEIQLRASIRRIGVGKVLFGLLEKVARRTRHKYLMLTVFNSNESAIAAFGRLGFVRDRICPDDCDYMILSKRTTTK